MTDDGGRKGQRSEVREQEIERQKKTVLALCLNRSAP
jgi:hypothetical protein